MHADPAWRARVESVPIEGCTVKLNVLLSELPNFTARPGTLEPHHYGQINAPLTKSEWKAGFAAARLGELPEALWCELYFQSVHDASVVPAGQHTMSVFAQYVPYTFASGTSHGGWDSRRNEVQRPRTGLHRPLLLQHRPSAVIDVQVLGPPDIEAEGRPHRRPHLPGRMPPASTCGPTASPPAPPCPASTSAEPATHPGGSVIGINGRNAAMAVLRDLGKA